MRLKEVWWECGVQRVGSGVGVSGGDQEGVVYVVSVAVVEGVVWGWRRGLKWRGGSAV